VCWLPAILRRNTQRSPPAWTTTCGSSCARYLPTNTSFAFFPFLGIRDILVRIVGILLFSSLTFKMSTKNKFFSPSFYAYSFLKVHLHHSSEKKSQRSHRTVEMKIFFIFLLVDGSIRSQIRIRKNKYVSGCESWRSKNIQFLRIRIRMRIRNTSYFPVKCQCF
jgi:hypothetical protein